VTFTPISRTPALLEFVATATEMRLIPLMNTGNQGMSVGARRAAREATSGSLARPGWAFAIWCDPLETGGVCQAVLNLANQLKVQGVYRPVVIVKEWAAVRPRLEMRDGVQYVFVRMRDPPDDPPPLYKQVRNSLLAWPENRRVLRLMRELDIRVVNSHYPTLADEMFVAKPAVVGGRPLTVIFSLHGMDIRGADVAGIEYRTRYINMLSRGSAVVAASHSLADFVTNRLAPDLAGKVSFIHNGVSAATIQNYDPIETTLPARYILNVATFETKKGQCYLLDAFSQIADRYPDLHLVLAGRATTAANKTILNALREQVSLLGLDNRVLFFQDIPHAKIGALYSSAALFCLSSLTETFPLVLLEAGAFRLPVIATRVDGVPELICQNRDGILVDNGDATQLAEGISALLDSPDRGLALAASLHDRVLRHFGWCHAAERYLALAASL
jgi:glycosyltransferase involved in cell wall biosynthesis